MILNLSLVLSSFGPWALRCASGKPPRAPLVPSCVRPNGRSAWGPPRTSRAPGRSQTESPALRRPRPFFFTVSSLLADADSRARASRGAMYHVYSVVMIARAFFSSSRKLQMSNQAKCIRSSALLQRSRWSFTPKSWSVAFIAFTQCVDQPVGVIRFKINCWVHPAVTRGPPRRGSQPATATSLHNRIVSKIGQFRTPVGSMSSRTIRASPRCSPPKIFPGSCRRRAR